MPGVWSYLMSILSYPAVVWVFAFHSYIPIIFLYWLNRNAILLIANLTLASLICVSLYLISH
jgi:hypothetical protein